MEELMFGSSIKKASYINELLEKMRFGPDIKEVMYLFDYNDDWYNMGFHDNKTLEPKVDKALSYLSYICYLRKQRIISKREFCFFEYQINRTLMNSQTQDYLYNLYHFAQRSKASISFSPLIVYGKKAKIITDDFYDKTSYI